jgi:hypothetical protein
MRLIHFLLKNLTNLLILFVIFAEISGLSHAAQLNFDLDAPPYREKEAFAIARQLGKLGIKVNACILEPALSYSHSIS